VALMVGRTKACAKGGRMVQVTVAAEVAPAARWRRRRRGSPTSRAPGTIQAFFHFLHWCCDRKASIESKQNPVTAECIRPSLLKFVY
jgi:hypothetical protein